MSYDFWLMKQKTNTLYPTYDGIIQLSKVSMYTFRPQYKVNRIKPITYFTLTCYFLFTLWQ